MTKPLSEQEIERTRDEMRPDLISNEKFRALCDLALSAKRNETDAERWRTFLAMHAEEHKAGVIASIDSAKGSQ